MGDGRRPIGFLAAVQFLTRIPIRLRTAPDLGRAVPWFPVVGALIGLSTGAVAAGLIELVPATVAAAVAVLSGVVITGAFHEDGLADTADALAGTTPERRREILQDSRHGTYGVAALSGSIVLRIVCVASLGPAHAFAALVTAHSLARGAAVATMALAPPVPTAGLGADSMRSVSPAGAAAGVAIAVAAGAAATGWWVVPLGGGAIGGAVLVALPVRRLFGGVSGDILGAVEQVVECIVLVVASGLAMHHALWWR